MKSMFAAVSAAVIALASSAALGAAKPDDDAVTLYNADGGFIAEVCYHGTSCNFLFTKDGESFCAVLESVPTLKDGVMSRDIYVLDRRNATNKEMVLSVFHRIDTFDNGASATFVKDIPLGINGGSNAKCKMVQGPKYVILGTDLSNHAVKISKKKLKASEVASGPTTLLSTDSRGYTTISDTDSGGYKLMDPNMVPILSGGIASQTAGNQTATLLN